MPDEVHIAVSGSVLQQLRELEPPERELIRDGLYNGHLAANARSYSWPMSPHKWYTCSMDGYWFVFRELTRDELDGQGIDFGYYVLTMEIIPRRLQRKLMG